MEFKCFARVYGGYVVLAQKLVSPVPKIKKNSIDMAPSTGSQSTAQNAAHYCEQVPFLALPGLVEP